MKVVSSHVQYMLKRFVVLISFDSLRLLTQPPKGQITVSIMQVQANS